MSEIDIDQGIEMETKGMASMKKRVFAAAEAAGEQLSLKLTQESEGGLDANEAMATIELLLLSVVNGMCESIDMKDKKKEAMIEKVRTKYRKQIVEYTLETLGEERLKMYAKE